MERWLKTIKQIVIGWMIKFEDGTYHGPDYSVRSVYKTEGTAKRYTRNMPNRTVVKVALTDISDEEGGLNGQGLFRE